MPDDRTRCPRRETADSAAAPGVNPTELIDSNPAKCSTVLTSAGTQEMLTFRSMTRKGLFGATEWANCGGMSENSPSNGFSHAFETLVAHFESNDFKFHADNESKSVQLFITGDYAVYNCRVQLTHDDELIQVRIHYPVVARDAKIRPLVAEALARANHGMAIGNFDIDMDTGDINFHLGQVIRGQSLNDEIIGGVFSASLSTAIRYFPAVMRVMFAGHTPTDAVYLSELDVHAEAVQDGGVESAVPRLPAKPVARKPKRPRKDPRSRTTKELPGLFDKKREDKDGGPDRS